MLRDGLIEESLIVGVVIAGEGRGTTLEGKIKDYISGVSSPLTPYKRYRGVGGKRHPSVATEVRRFVKDRQQNDFNLEFSQ